MNHDERIAKAMHDAHLRYQRAQLRGDSAGDNALPCSEQRGCRYRAPKRTLAQQLSDAALMQASFTRLRANFWRGYIETLMFMAK